MQLVEPAVTAVHIPSTSAIVKHRKFPQSNFPLSRCLASQMFERFNARSDKSATIATVNMHGIKCQFDDFLRVWKVILIT